MTARNDRRKMADFLLIAWGHGHDAITLSSCLFFVKRRAHYHRFPSEPSTALLDVLHLIDPDQDKYLKYLGKDPCARSLAAKLATIVFSDQVCNESWLQTAMSAAPVLVAKPDVTET
jgi:hypothetical protein